MARVSIEDCLQFLENRFALVTVAADRARQLMQGEDALLRTKNKEAVTALREIADGLVVKKEFRAAPGCRTREQWQCGRGTSGSSGNVLAISKSKK